MSYTLVFNTDVSSTFTNPVAGCNWSPVLNTGNTQYTTTASPSVMPGFAFISRPWSASLIQVLNIPSNVTTIGQSAFGLSSNNSCNSLTTVTTVSNNTVLNRVEQNAFAFCNSLTSINIPGSNIVLANSCFASCANLQTITLNSLESLVDSVFIGSTKITSITVTNATSNYSSLDGNLYNVTKTQLVKYAVGKTATSFEIPSSVTSIGNYSFQLCSSITTVIIPNSVTYIGEAAFQRCSSLTSINIPSNVTLIGSSAFEFCSALQSITIPAGLTIIQPSTFKNCSSLTNVSFSANSTLTTIQIRGFMTCNLLKTITLPASVTSIAGYAFRENTSLNTVIVSSTLLVGTATDAFSLFSGDKIPNLYTTAANYPPNNPNLTNQFTNVYLLNTNYYTIQSGQTKDLCDVFTPLTSTPAAATGFLVKNYGGTGLTKDLNQIFEALPVGGRQAQATNLIVANYNGTGQKDLNQIFKPI